MNNIITANQLKTKGISIADNFAKKGLETIVTVRGKAKYVILPKEQYNNLLEQEILHTLKDAKQDLKNKNYHTGSIEDHLKRIEND